MNRSIDGSTCQSNHWSTVKTAPNLFKGKEINDAENLAYMSLKLVIHMAYNTPSSSKFRKKKKDHCLSLNFITGSHYFSLPLTCRPHRPLPYFLSLFSSLSLFRQRKPSKNPMSPFSFSSSTDKGIATK
jgi:hypothetical protein